MWVEVSESDLCMYALVGFRGCCRLVVVFSLIGCAISFCSCRCFFRALLVQIKLRSTTNEYGFSL